MSSTVIEPTASPTAAAALHEVRVRTMRWEAENVLSLELVDAAGVPVPEWRPGAHLDLLLGPGLERQYSLCGSPDHRRSWTVAVLREENGRGGSEFVHTRLRPGSVLTVRGPKNNFALVDSPEYLFVAGGIGITPILPMIAEAARTGRPWRLVYGGRTRSSMAFVERLTALGGTEQVVIHPQDEAGHPDLAGAVAGLGEGGVVYACGPEPLLAALETVCRDRGVPLHLERFTAKAVEAPASRDTFVVECRRSNVIVEVDPDESIVEALEERGLRPRHSCLDGLCGTCETVVLEGTPDHRDSVMMPEEAAAGNTMMICVSRSRSPRLILDL